MNVLIRLTLRLVSLFAAAVLALAAVFTGAYYYVEPGLPEAVELRDIRFQIPLSVYSRDGRLMAQFGEQKRTPVPYEEIPELLIKAVLAAEDHTFFEHSGFDPTGTARAIFNFLTTPGGERVAGGSTITQQVARDNFLSRDYSVVRKFRELLIAHRIEQEFTKEEILGLFLNTTFFGQSSFGVYATARTYFDKSLDELTLSEVAIIAGIPQGPSIMNPYNGPENAANRRSYVLRRMHELGYITTADREAALNEPIESRRYGQQTALEANYVAEMVRAEMIRRFGPAAYTDGLKVTTTVDSRLQTAATGSLRETLIDYDERHGYKGPVGRIDLEEHGVFDHSGVIDEQKLTEVMADYPPVLDLDAAVVLAVEEPLATIYLRGLGVTHIGLETVSWARPYLSEGSTGAFPDALSDVLAVGDVVRFRRNADGLLRLAQLPEVQGAFVSLDPLDGAIVALTGGFEYFLNNYNRATQSLRQPGSAFKPFIYSAAFERGFTPASIVNDAPIVEESTELETTWKPQNFSGLGHGEVPLRDALKNSWNLAAIRTLRDIGVPNAAAQLRRFGFNADAMPQDLSLALGNAAIAPLDLARGYAVFANGGYLVKPYFIQRIEDADGQVLYDAGRSAVMVCRNDGTERSSWCEAEARPERYRRPQLVDNATELFAPYRHAERTVRPQNVYLITDILQDVVVSGSGARAYRELGRRDLAGKTGTTNGPRDAWFAGFNADIVGVAWVGFDDDRSMGDREQGGVTAIPIWINFMAEALQGQPEHALARPPGIEEVRINPDNGLVASDANPNAVWEIFEVGTVPAREPDAPYVRGRLAPTDDGPRAADEPIF